MEHKQAFEGFPVGDTKEEFEAAVDRLFDQVKPPPPKISYAYGQNLPIRWGRVVSGEGHVLACPRRPVADLMGILPIRFIETQEHNQQISSCCRHPENHDIEGWFSNAEEEQRGTPDIYILHCTCGRRHIRFMCGGGFRPTWR